MRSNAVTLRQNQRYSQIRLLQCKSYAMSDECRGLICGEADDGAKTHRHCAWLQDYSHAQSSAYVAQAGIQAVTCSWFFSIQAAAAASCVMPSTSTSAAAWSIIGPEKSMFLIS